MTFAMDRLWQLDATCLVNALQDRRLRVKDIAGSCLDRIHQYDKRWAAFVALDPGADDGLVCVDGETRPLSGIPVGIKDVIDVAGFPTQANALARKAMIAPKDAFCVARLREAGAIIIGKTATAELAYAFPPRTQNPAVPGHTPGGSSSGSAAAVAGGLVPLAIGTQTGGSVIRPAAYCGIYGYKPSWGAIPLDGVLPLAPSLDTIGLFARSLRDICVIWNVLRSPEEQVSAPTRPKLTRIGICRAPDWAFAEHATQLAVDQAAILLREAGIEVFEPQLERDLAAASHAAEVILACEAAVALPPLVGGALTTLRPQTRQLIAQGASFTCAALAQARDVVERSKRWLAGIFADCPLILTASAPGPAPAGYASTGSSHFNRGWTALGGPCLNLPFTRLPDGKPIGIQIVGQPDRDDLFLALATQLQAILFATSETCRPAHAPN